MWRCLASATEYIKNLLTSDSKGLYVMTQYKCTIPCLSGDPLDLLIETGRSMVIIGANGSGKTRLGVYIEAQIPAQSVQRISAQKSLTFNDSLSIISLERAENFLRYGTPDGQEAHKAGSRWGGKAATHFLSDFDALLQALFAAHNRVASTHLRDRKENPNIPVPTTKLEQLKTIWDRLLPHRTLDIHEASITILPSAVRGAMGYPASEMSDGERAIFYFLGQCLVAPDNGVIIIDEPEIHVHKAILGSLWDAAEKARPDCGFMYITHDLDFAVTHSASEKYYIRAYNHEPSQWTIERFPQDTGLPEQTVAELVGSRKPILFVEGDRSSLDLTVYRSLYEHFTIMPIGGCEAVIHSVTSYKGSDALHWLQVHGLVDGDHRDAEHVSSLNKRGIYVLPVAEVENLFLLPPVFRELAAALLCDDPSSLLARLTTEVMNEATANLDLVSARYTIRHLDRRLKTIQVKAKDLATLQATYQSELATVDPAAIFNDFKATLSKKIQEINLSGVLQLYDNKGLLTRATILLGVANQDRLLEKIGRLLGQDEGKMVRDALTKALPSIPG